MTNREAAIELWREVYDEPGAMPASERELEPFLRKLDAAERRGAIAILRKLLRVFRVEFICKGWCQRQIEHLEAGGAIEPVRAELLAELKAEENKR